MLRYLAKDYLAEALQHHRDQLEHLSVACPHHIEFVNPYVHKGDIKKEDDHVSHWNILEKMADYQHLPYSSICCTDSSIASDLAILMKDITTSTLQLLGNGVEQYLSPHSDIDDDLGLLSQDIDSAMERFITPSNDTCVSLDAFPKENFTPARLLNHEVQVDEGYAGYLLEELEPSLHLEGLLQLMPTVESLAARLKPKMVQDPFLDPKGKPYSYANLLSRSDFHFDCDTSGEIINEELETHFCEKFERDESVSEAMAKDIDPLMELAITETEKPLADDAAESALPISLTPESEPANETSSDLEKLVDHYPGLGEVESAPGFSPEEMKVKEFVELNDQGIGHDSADSGIGHALLESPYIPPCSPSSHLTSTPLIQLQLSQLNPMPLSPEGQLFILSPSSVKKQLEDIREKEKVFDSILALTLPCLNTNGGIESMAIYTIKDILDKLEFQPTKFDGDAELELNWDPLEASYEDMSIASKTLLCHKPQFDSNPIKAGALLEKRHIWKETFKYDESTKEEAEREALSPIRTVDETTQGESGNLPLENDIPNLILKPAAPTGYLKPLPLPHPTTSSPVSLCVSSTAVDPWNLVQRAGSDVRSSTANASKKDLYNFRVSPQCKQKTAMPIKEGKRISALDAFIMLRSEATNERPILVRRKRTTCTDSESVICDESEKKRRVNNGDAEIELEIIEKITSPVFQDVCLSGKYLSAMSKMESLALSLRAQLEGSGHHVPVRGTWPREISVDSLKFFLKQQQKLLEDAQSTNRESLGDALRNCQLAACLYLTGSVMDALTHCSHRTALSRFSSLHEKYSELLNDRISPLREVLIEFESDELLPPHPKLSELVKVVSQWKKESRKSCRDKVVVVVAREFAALSGEILDYLQSIPGFESCVFSFTSNETSSELYKKAVEERFHHYDCLVVPTTALSDHSCFLWEKVSLLVEYEMLKKPLFGDLALIDCDKRGHVESENRVSTVSVLERLHLQKYITLRTVLDLSASSISFSSVGNGITYTVVASERVTSNSQLLQLLETRYNVLVVERDYSILTPSKWLSWADLCVSERVGILLRPLSTLASEAGGRGLIRTVTGLSLQYHKCWVILYQEDQSSYELGGCVPHQLSLLHASVAPLDEHYRVSILMSFSIPHVAQLIRKIIQETHKETGTSDWEDRSWLNEELSKKEKLLLSFPCINSFSAQLMLRKFTLSGLFAADLSQLRENLPGIPEKILKLFYGICHANAVAATGYLPTIPALPDCAKLSPISKSKEQEFTSISSYDINESVQTQPLEDQTNYITTDDNRANFNFANTVVTSQDNIGLPPSDHSDFIVSSHITGLDDSLEEFESKNLILNSNEQPETEHNTDQSLFHANLDPWINSAQNFLTISNDPDTTVKFSQSKQSKPEEDTIDTFTIPPMPRTVVPNVGTIMQSSRFQPTHLTYKHEQPFLMSSFPNNVPATNADLSYFSHHVSVTDNDSCNSDNTTVPQHSWNLNLDAVTDHKDTWYGTSFLRHQHDMNVRKTKESQFAPLLHQSSTSTSTLTDPLFGRNYPLTSSSVSSTSDPLFGRNYPSTSTSVSSTSDTLFPRSYLPTTSSSSDTLFGRNYLVPKSSRIIASSVVRKPLSIPATQRIPVKALNLGAEGRKKLKLQSNDRLIFSQSPRGISSDNARLPHPLEDNKAGFGLSDNSTGKVVRSQYFPVVSSTVSSGRLISSSKVCAGASRPTDCKNVLGHLPSLTKSHLPATSFRNDSVSCGIATPKCDVQVSCRGYKPEAFKSEHLVPASGAVSPHLGQEATSLFGSPQANSNWDIFQPTLTQKTFIRKQ